jgi:hypothetical protein
VAHVPRDGDERNEEERLLPGGDHIERRSSHAEVPQLRHRALCRTSPMTRIAIAIPVTRRALIDDRHQRHAESDDADAPREEGLEAPPRQEVDLGRKPLSGLR